MSWVGFMIKNTIANKLENLPVGISDRTMTLRIPLQDGLFATLVSIYAPTLQADNVVKEAFYAEPTQLLNRIKATDKRIVLGGFNARVGRDHDMWPKVLGQHGIGNCIVFNQLEEFYPQGVSEFKKMVRKHDIDIPKGICKDLSDKEFDIMIDVALMLVPLWENALGKNWRNIITYDKLKVLYQQM